MRAIVATVQRPSVSDAEFDASLTELGEGGRRREACKVLEERAEGEGAFLRVRGDAETVKRLRLQFGRSVTG